jgi:nicotinamide mononucleotide transporter
MKEWRGYNYVDLVLLLFGVITIIVVSIFTMPNWYLIVNAVLACLCVFTQAKGKVVTQFIGLTWSGFYLYIAITQSLWGEVILNLGVVVPMYVYGIINWMRNKQNNDNVVKVADLSKKELMLVGFSYIPVFVIVYFLLQALNTAQLFGSTLSFAFLIPAMYLLIRRSRYNIYAFLLQDMVCPILWIGVVMDGNPVFLLMVVSILIQLVYDVYAIIEWNKLEKKQKQKGLG